MYICTFLNICDINFKIKYGDEIISKKVQFNCIWLYKNNVTIFISQVNIFGRIKPTQNMKRRNQKIL